MTEKITGKTIIFDIFALNVRMILPLMLLLKIIKGLNTAEELSLVWWMAISMILMMVQTNFIQFGVLDRSRKYLKAIFNKYPNLIPKKYQG